MRRPCFVLAALLSACAGRSAEPAPPAARSNPSAVKRDAASCSPDGAAELLERHARAYGSPEQVLRTLPRELSGTIRLGDTPGTLTLKLRSAGFTLLTKSSAFELAKGKDERGFWDLGIHGVIVDLRPDEAQPIALTDWLLRRGYVSESKAARLTCDGPRALLRYEKAAVGSPELGFDWATARLDTVRGRKSDGLPTNRTIEAWSEPDADGVRWWKKVVDQSTTGQGSTFEITENARIENDELERPDGTIGVVWPDGKTRVDVPMRVTRDQILVRAKVGKRDAWALLDAGAGLTVIDSTTPLVDSFESRMQISGASATQKVKLGLGELHSVSIGALGFERLPVASTPIPGLANFGTPRPELILGYSLFPLTVVRVDYAKQQISFAKRAEELRSKDAVAVPIQLWEGKIVAGARLETTDASFHIDTGSSGAFDLHEKWAKAHGLPGARPSAVRRGLYSAGNDETPSTLLRIQSAVVGPAKLDDFLASIDDTPTAGDLAGRIGNRALARCSALVFDLEARTLWFEPPCDRPFVEANTGWELEWKPAGPKSAHPWVVKSLIDGAAAHGAGVQAGDRLISVGGRPAVADLDKFFALLTAKSGTRVPIVVERDGKPVRLTLELRKTLATPNP